MKPRAQDSRQSEVAPESGKTTLDILKAMLREVASEDGAVNSSLEQGSVAQSAPRWKSRSKKGPTAPMKPRAQDSRQSEVAPESGGTTLDRLTAILREQTPDIIPSLEKGSVARGDPTERPNDILGATDRKTLEVRKLNVLRSLLARERSELSQDGAVNSSLEQGSVARSAPTEAPNQELGAVMNEKTPRFPFEVRKNNRAFVLSHQIPLCFFLYPNPLE
ncbi:hypothetical protein C8R47DRAFT_1234509 [Mycena vitilis]|nr:hypothetical protein C8R47DRAFT_1234509 [Mycena vitilis]